MTRAKAVADVAWTLVILGVIAYQARGEIRTAFTRRRAQLDAQRQAAVERSRHRAFIERNRERYIEAEFAETVDA